MKTTEVNKKIIGRRCKCIFTGLLVTGVIEDTTEDKYTVSVKVRFDTPQQWGDEFYSYDWSFGRKADDSGSLIVTFGDPIDTLDGIFEDVKTWGVCSLKGWIDSYESTRFTPIDADKAVITSEYNMECVKEWLEHNTPIKDIIIG